MEKDCLDLFVCLEFTDPSGAPNDGFLQNTLKKRFYAIQSTFRSVEMHFKGRYKIFICSVAFRNYKGFSTTSSPGLFPYKKWFFLREKLWGRGWASVLFSRKF